MNYKVKYRRYRQKRKMTLRAIDFMYAFNVCMNIIHFLLVAVFIVSSILTRSRSVSGEIKKKQWWSKDIN